MIICSLRKITVLNIYFNYLLVSVKKTKAGIVNNKLIDHSRNRKESIKKKMTKINIKRPEKFIELNKLKKSSDSSGQENESFYSQN